MAQRTQLDDANNPLHEAYACLLANGLDGAGEALRILVNEASRIERAQYLQASPYERSAQRVDYANGYKDKTVLKCCKSWWAQRSASPARKSAVVRRCWTRACTPGARGLWMRRRT